MELIAQVPSLKKPPEFGANIDMLALRVIAADWLNLLSAHSFLQRKLFELGSEEVMTSVRSTKKEEKQQNFNV